MGNQERKTCLDDWGKTQWFMPTRLEHNCHNSNLRFATKAKAYKGVDQEGSLGVTSHALGSVGECEGMNLHTPKWTPTLRVGVSMDS